MGKAHLKTQIGLKRMGGWAEQDGDQSAGGWIRPWNVASLPSHPLLLLAHWCHLLSLPYSDTKQAATLQLPTHFQRQPHTEHTVVVDLQFHQTQWRDFSPPGRRAVGMLEEVILSARPEDLLFWKALNPMMAIFRYLMFFLLISSTAVCLFLCSLFLLQVFTCFWF